VYRLAYNVDVVVGQNGQSTARCRRSVLALLLPREQSEDASPTPATSTTNNSPVSSLSDNRVQLDVSTLVPLGMIIDLNVLES